MTVSKGFSPVGAAVSSQGWKTLVKACPVPLLFGFQPRRGGRE
jgi:hypothetical protein